MAGEILTPPVLHQSPTDGTNFIQADLQNYFPVMQRHKTCGNPVCIVDVDGPCPPTPVSVSCEYKVAHHKPEQTCHIQHTASGDYIKVEENDKLVLRPLKEGDINMKYMVELFACYDCTHSPVVVCVFKLLNRTAYITVISEDQVGIQVLDPIQPDTKFLNSDDRRFFSYDLSTNTMMSTAFPGHYLAATGDNVTLKKVKKEDVPKDWDIKFKLKPRSCHDSYWSHIKPSQERRYN